MFRHTVRIAAAVLLGGLCVVTGCSSSSDTASADTLTANVGAYPPAPGGLRKVRVGVPPFTITQSGDTQRLDEIAADQMTTLAQRSQRFSVIERAQTEQLLKEQGMEGIVTPEELAKSGKVRGVEYLIIGKVSNLRVKPESSTRGFSLANVNIPGTGGGGIGAFDIKNKNSKITTECGVDLRLVNPSTGEALAAHFGEFKRTDSISAMGVDILGASADADAQLELTEDDKGKILRLALDEALRKMLPEIDQELMARQASAPAAPVAPASPAVESSNVAPAAVAPGAAAAKKFCGHCGKEMGATSKFCPACGAAAN